MVKPTDSATRPLQLAQLGVIAVRGPASRSFLQGQLSQQLDALEPARALLAGYHTPQGRVLAVLRLLPQGAEDVLMVLPRELATPIATRLARYVLRAKARVVDESAQWRVQGHDAIGAGRAGWADRWISIVASDDAPPALAQDEAAWRAADIRAGLPQVYAATSEQFVAQMLNLDALGGIAFDKGCYTGQEIIARAHYRGRVKRRMQAFVSNDAQQIAPGERLALSDGRSAQVVDAQRLTDGSQHFLAVTALLVATGDSQTEPDAGDAAAAGRSVQSQPLALPYELPA